MKEANLDEIARKLADGLRGGFASQRPELYGQLLWLLAEGRPVSPEQIATALDIPHDEVTAALRQLPNVELDHEGNIVGCGLTLTPTPHHFQVSGHELFTWCALDTLIFPAILNQPARVESTCPVTGEKVQLTVTPEGVEDLEPASAVVSITIPEASEACCDVRGAFCNQVHFFSSSEAASTWLAEHPGAIILPVKDAYKLGRKMIEHRFGEISDV